METPSAIERELAEEQQRHEARKAEIRQQAERREQEYTARMLGIDEAERIATDAVKAGFDAQRKQLEAEFNGSAEEFAPEADGGTAQPGDLLSGHNEIGDAVSAINKPAN